MRQYSQGSNQPSKHQLMRRLDRAFGDLNVFLAALAIGLAVLDLTCLYGVTVGRSLTTALYEQAPQSVASPGPPATQRRSHDSSQ
jgi:hypothetical protein